MKITLNKYLPGDYDYIDQSIDQKTKPENERDIRFIGTYGEVTIKYRKGGKSFIDDNYYPSKYIATIRQNQIDAECDNIGILRECHGSRDTAIENLYASIGRYIARKDSKKAGIGCAGILDDNFSY
jgi:hypothetical protein